MFRSPHRLYRLLAVAEVITWAMLISGMILKYVLHVTELGVRIGGGIHGFVFLAYCAATVLVGVDQRWGAGRIALGLGSAVIPFVTVAFERWAERRGMLAEVWRLLTESPRTAAERLAAVILRCPVLSAVVILVLVAVVFALLLQAGPPTQWFS
ncbi:DUF3817 domain-containing protein [Brachybacterium nesterenkovii]|uniref:Hypothetical membrane protein n=1 Tax=Brachybacterium nesterenkovii TaxID=47847 RepID=A0A1X6X7B3_9MICO|nr:DUF3817 domain-containing protein [Brachybacterium nesterenkovii]SLM95102.1 hypothetical membrane protein [Brachybacterium nesterenkovii]